MASAALSHVNEHLIVVRHRDLHARARDGERPGPRSRPPAGRSETRGEPRVPLRPRAEPLPRRLSIPGKRIHARPSCARRAHVRRAHCYAWSMSPDARRAARATWETTVSREPTASQEEEDDLYWLRVPRDERAQLTWDLSRELYSLAARNGGVFDEETGSFVDVGHDDLERRLPRAAFVVTRR